MAAQCTLHRENFIFIIQNMHQQISFTKLQRKKEKRLITLKSVKVRVCNFQRLRVHSRFHICISNLCKEKPCSPLFSATSREPSGENPISRIGPSSRFRTSTLLQIDRQIDKDISRIVLGLGLGPQHSHRQIDRQIIIYQGQVLALGLELQQSYRQIDRLEIKDRSQLQVQNFNNPIDRQIDQKSRIGPSFRVTTLIRLIA